VIEQIKGRLGDDREIADAEDISGGVEEDVANVSSFTLYISAAAAVNVTVKMTPDGSTWYTIPESPIEFSEAGDAVLHVDYDTSAVQLTGSNGTSVTAQIKEVV
jgi:hypothetical protein